MLACVCANRPRWHPGGSVTVEEFIERWSKNEGGAERANFPLFLTELCSLLDLPQPDPADATHEHNDYVFERSVAFRDEAGKTGHGRIDLYRRGCFVLEAKQSRQKGGAKEVALTPGQESLPGLTPPPTRGRRSAHRAWDVLMRKPPPFSAICAAAVRSPLPQSPPATCKAEKWNTASPRPSKPWSASATSRRKAMNIGCAGPRDGRPAGEGLGDWVEPILHKITWQRAYCKRHLEMSLPAS